MPPADPAARPSAVPWPPLLLLATVVLGWALERVAPLPWLGAAAARGVGALGLFLLVSALGTELWVARGMGRVRTTVMPHRSATRLVTTGLFGRSRNPIYVAHVTLVLGLGLWKGNLWWLVAAPVLAALLERLAIRPEERHLRAVFGAEYERYCARVRRWI